MNIAFLKLSRPTHLILLLAIVSSPCLQADYDKPTYKFITDINQAEYLAKQAQSLLDIAQTQILKTIAEYQIIKTGFFNNSEKYWKTYTCLGIACMILGGYITIKISKWLEKSPYFTLPKPPYDPQKTSAYIALANRLKAEKETHEKAFEQRSLQHTNELKALYLTIEKLQKTVEKLKEKINIFSFTHAPKPHNVQIKPTFDDYLEKFEEKESYHIPEKPQPHVTNTPTPNSLKPPQLKPKTDDEILNQLFSQMLIGNRTIIQKLFSLLKQEKKENVSQDDLSHEQ